MTIIHYLESIADLPFYRIFGKHADLLTSFLNALMPFEEGRHIVSLEYLSQDQLPDNPAKKDSIVNVKCKDNFDRDFIVEIQIYWNDLRPTRILANASKNYQSWLNTSDQYNLLLPVYALGILNATFDYDTAQFYHHYKTVWAGNSHEVIEGFEFILVELPKFKSVLISEKKMAVLWLRFLTEVTEKAYSVSEELLENEEISKAIELCKVGAFTKADFEAYENFWDIVRTENSIISSNNAKLSCMRAKEVELAKERAEKEVERAEKEAALKREEALLAEIAALKNNKTIEN
jgi:predicted transposase/invertase (TIGR01784 family)